MRLFTRAVLVSIGTLALAATGASAEVVCNDEGDCWHVRGKSSTNPNSSCTDPPKGVGATCVVCQGRELHRCEG